MKAKGRYVATIIMDVDIDFNHANFRAFEDVKEDIMNGKLTKAITELLEDKIAEKPYVTLNVTQQFADFYSAEEV